MPNGIPLKENSLLVSLLLEHPIKKKLSNRVSIRRFFFITFFLYQSFNLVAAGIFFSLATGKSFREALNDVRTDKAKLLLTDTDRSIMEIAGDVGYTDQSYFCRVFKSYTGESPLNYRNNRRRTKKTHEKLVVK